ncbi:MULTISPECIES: hypothetical protein [unclassified Streptomyces]|uniref:hypothetical protein n=1 Tax=unclassified Streptomyces TaxID=2593676 RepID=UPI00136F9018|nr:MULTISPECIES: hypothetical protein [unclassified Streptomyces]MYY87072.1 hypothetical protein [Streptomyces sp. SID335]MYZ18134.1 hypothetical protein [Streptomyces sp. SID337]NDZ89507.1 hypothetical protein [Streptomyces sp. SID10115]NEA05125.1 hypothetical protein [Streptomyces sp. SID10116]
MSPALLGARTVSGSSAELRSRAGSFTTRKVLRLLAPWSLAPFVTVLELREAAWPTGWNGDRTGLITISGLEPGFGVLAPTGEAGPASVEEHLAQVLERKPTEWLSEMVNNPACQASIVSQLHGPSLHYVGDADTCRLALLQAAAWLESETVDGVVVVAFDDGDRPADTGTDTDVAAADTTESPLRQSAGVALGRGDIAAMDDVDRLTGGRGTPGTAIEAMTALVTALEPTAPRQTD